MPTKVCLIKAMFFQWSWMDVSIGLWRKMSAEELMFLNCGIGEDSLESPLDSKEIQPVHPKGNQSWLFIGRTDAELRLQYFGRLMRSVTHWKRPWCWGGLKAGGEGGGGGWDGWMASPTQWPWIWANSGRPWRTEKSDMLQSMGSQRVRHDLVTEHTETHIHWPFWFYSLYVSFLASLVLFRCPCILPATAFVYISSYLWRFYICMKFQLFISSSWGEILYFSVFWLY